MMMVHHGVQMVSRHVEYTAAFVVKDGNDAADDGRADDYCRIHSEACGSRVCQACSGSGDVVWLYFSS